jgi:hypothetical protein
VTSSLTHCFGLYRPSSGVDICWETAALFLLFNIFCIILFAVVPRHVMGKCIFIRGLFGDTVITSDYRELNGRIKRTMSWERIGRKRSWRNLKLYSGVCIEWLRKTMKNFSQGDRCLGKCAWSYTTAPLYIFTAWKLIKHTEHTNPLCGKNLEFQYATAGGTYSNHWALKG